MVAFMHTGTRLTAGYRYTTLGDATGDIEGWHLPNWLIVESPELAAQSNSFLASKRCLTVFREPKIRSISAGNTRLITVKTESVYPTRS